MGKESVMANRKASFNAIAAIITGLSDEEQSVLVEKGKEFKEFVAGLVRAAVENTFFTHVDDKDAPAHLVGAVAKWRKLASDLGYTGPVLWAVKAGFTLKLHAPLAGPCYEKFSYLQDWELKNDEPTVDCLVFFIPRMVATKKNAEEQMQALVELREKYGLPASHCASFGSAALVAGLIMAHFKRTGERAPLNTDWVRTDTRYSVGSRLHLGGFDEAGLHCYVTWDDHRYGSLGVFPLGVELGS
ncbi:MAG: hypothetical protein PHD72_03820 [Patescibacteria group bacterium]|nr:hypothetical protein [Patescibacteria group bacterium]